MKNMIETKMDLDYPKQTKKTAFAYFTTPRAVLKRKSSRPEGPKAGPGLGSGLGEYRQAA